MKHKKLFESRINVIFAVLHCDKLKSFLFDSVERGVCQWNFHQQSKNTIQIANQMKAQKR